MNLLEIKEKYKQILEEPESENSGDEWELAYSQMKQKRRRHILTQSNCINASSHSILDENALLKTKQKLAQCIVNLNKKDLQIIRLKQESVKYEQKIKAQEQQIFQLKSTFSVQQQKIIEEKVAYGCIEKDLELLSKNCEKQKLDKQLMQRQIDFYKHEIQVLKSQFEEKDKKYEQLTKVLKNIQKYKESNVKLKADVLRLRQLLVETQKYKNFANAIEYKHYLGKPNKEHECWFSESLIEETEKFLKKQQIGNGNKDFLTSLVRYISRHIEQTKRKEGAKNKKVLSSRVKEIERKFNHSLNFIEIREDTLKRSLLRSSMCKSRKTTNLNESKRCTESFIYQKLEKSLAAHEFDHHKELCCQMLSSFRKGIFELISVKEIRRKKVMKLVDWLVEGVLSIFPKDKIGPDFRLETEQIKISQ